MVVLFALIVNHCDCFLEIDAIRYIFNLIN